MLSGRILLIRFLLVSEDGTAFASLKFSLIGTRKQMLQPQITYSIRPGYGQSRIPPNSKTFSYPISASFCAACLLRFPLRQYTRISWPLSGSMSGLLIISSLLAGINNRKYTSHLDIMSCHATVVTAEFSKQILSALQSWEPHSASSYNGLK